MLAQNMQALPGTVLEDQPGALETGKTILPILKDDAAKKAAEQKKAAEDKEKAAKEVLGREIKQVAPWDSQEYAALTNSYRELVSNAFRVSDANPNDRSLDPREPGSKVRLEIDKAWDMIQQYQNSSSERFKQYNAELQAFDPNTMSELDLMEIHRVWTAPNSEAMTGKIPPKQAYGKLDLGTYFLDAAAKIDRDKDASAIPTGSGYIRTRTNEFVPEERIWASAKTIAAPSSTNGAYGHIKVLADGLQKNEPAEYERLTKAAEANGVTIHEQIAYESLEKNIGTKETADLSADATKSSGGYNDPSKDPRWWVQVNEGLYNGDPNIVRNVNLQNIPKNINLNDKSSRANAMMVINKIRKEAGIPESIPSEVLLDKWDAIGRPSDFGVFTDFSGIAWGAPINAEINDKMVEVNQYPTAIFRYTDPKTQETMYEVSLEPNYEKIAVETGTDVESAKTQAARLGVKPRVETYKKEDLPNALYGNQVQSGSNKNLVPGKVEKVIEEVGGNVSGGRVKFKERTTGKGETDVKIDVGGKPTTTEFEQGGNKPKFVGDAPIRK